MLSWTDDQLNEVGLDPKKIKSLVRRLRQCSQEMREMDLHVYGASGSGHLVHISRPTHIDSPGRNGTPDQGCSIATLGHAFDGGDW